MQAHDVGLSAEEYTRICQLMGRAPNDVELGLFGALWSEHCSYKSTKALLRQFKNDGPHVVQGPGENAGVVRLTDTVEVAFKVESHNHPSYIEPVQGAATGVGGILRDIIAMGARPVALADMLRFGRDQESQRLMQGVVKGIGRYGNAIGIPTVTGEVAYSPTYDTNPLVNVLAVGVRSAQRRIGVSGARPGDRLVLVGQRTGRDGIHGASLLASRDFTGDEGDLRPTVQVGDPFLGKLLMEATLETVSRQLASALQDLGAAGLSSALAELCYQSGVGAELRLDRVPLREPGLSAYEIMLSETQERMLMAVAEEDLEAVFGIFSHYELLATVIGRVQDEKRLTLWFADHVAATLNPDWLAHDVPQRSLAPDYWDSLAVAPPHVDLPAPAMTPEILLRVLRDPDVGDRSAIFSQYDSMIQANTVHGPHHDAAVLQVRGTDVGIVLAVAGTGRWAALDPYAGGAGAVLRALAAVAAQGAEALGMTDGVNAGNPEIPSSYAAMAGLLRGVADAAAACEVPVTGGNVSLHNETRGKAIWPTVMIGALGRHPAPLRPLADTLSEAGEVLYLVNPGPLDWGGSVESGQAYPESSYPRIDLSQCPRVLDGMRNWVLSGTARSVRTLGSGGLAATLVRMLAGADARLGVDLFLQEQDEALTKRLLNEAPLQWVASATPAQAPLVHDYWSAVGIPLMLIGTVTANGHFIVNGQHYGECGELLQAWHSAGEEAAI